MLKYAGIGSRETPTDVLRTMYLIGHHLAQFAVLRSGRAVGADMAFEAGARDASGYSDIFPPGDNTAIYPNWYHHAKRYHPAWSACSTHAKNCHARNSAIVLGAGLNDPVDFIVCWTRGGRIAGGTGQALRIATADEWKDRIRVFNLFNDPQASELRLYLGEALR
jgi:hypothetical protein